MGKKKESKIPVPTSDIGDIKIKFSFEYYDCTRKYCLSNWDKERILQSLISLKNINGKEHNELSTGYTYHFHAVDWDKTIKKGFPESKLNSNAWQFALPNVSSEEGARVFGSLYKNIFYIIWFDLHHEIWPVPLKHT